MITTTKDLFWLIASMSLGLFTILACWGIYYFIVVFRDASKIFASFKKKIDLVDNILKLIKEKLEKTSTHLSVISDSVIKIVGYIIDKQKGKKK